jgi:imidazolonepropionase-like amidohydrolase
MREIDVSRFDAIIARARAAGVAMVPTQILMDNYASNASGDALTSVPEMKYWVPAQVASWKLNKDNLIANPPAPAADREAYVALRRRLLHALHAAGVPILLGSDAPQLWNVPGFSAHRELQALVAAGLTPFQALDTGTVNVARFLNEEGRSGVIRAGARADLVLLDANPLVDIGNTMRISGVMVNGRWISSAERERMLGEFVAR